MDHRKQDEDERRREGSVPFGNLCKLKLKLIRVNLDETNSKKGFKIEK